MRILCHCKYSSTILDVSKYKRASSAGIHNLRIKAQHIGLAVPPMQRCDTIAKLAINIARDCLASPLTVHRDFISFMLQISHAIARKIQTEIESK